MMGKITNSRLSKFVNHKISYFHLGIIAIVVLLFYKATLSSYFIADDFWEIKYFSEGNIFHKIFSNFVTGEWEALPFYRPIAVLLYALSFALFKISPFGYHFVNVVLHIGNSILVYLLANKLTGGRNKNIGFTAGILFALYPLHPNTVSWIAAFATGYGTFFILSSFLAYLSFRQTSFKRYYFLSLLFFIFALGSYENAVVLPALILLYECTISYSNNLFRQARLFFLKSYLPFLCLLFGYFLLRKVVIGEFVGGYSNIVSDISIRNFLSLSINTLLNFKVINPVYSGMVGFKIRWMTNLLFFAFFSYLVVVIFLKNRPAFLRLFFSLGWMFVSAAAFLFYRFDPASSRVLHLYSVGFCLGISFLVFDGLFFLQRKKINLIGLGCISLILFYYSFLLFQHIGKYQYAADSARLIQKQLIDLYKSSGSSGTVFLLDYPAYVSDQLGKINLAPRYQIGISDALDRPFVRDKARVYPLPKLNLSELRPLFLSSDEKTFCSWNEGSQSIQVLSFEDFKGDNLPEIEVLSPENLASLDNNNLEKDIIFKPGPYRNFSLVILTDLIPIKHRFTIMESNSGVVHVNLFTEPKLFPFRFYGRDKVYWWISAIDANGLVVAQSKLRTFMVKRDR